MSNPRQTAQELIDVTFSIAHAMKRNADHFKGLTRDELNEFVVKQFADSRYYVAVPENGTIGILRLDSPKP